MVVLQPFRLHLTGNDIRPHRDAVGYICFSPSASTHYISRFNHIFSLRQTLGVEGGRLVVWPMFAFVVGWI